MMPTIALGDVHNLFVRSLSAVTTAINPETRGIEMAEHARQSPKRVAAVAAMGASSAVTPNS